MRSGRREFIAGVGVTSVATAGGWALWPERVSGSTDDSARARSLTIVFDEQLPDSRAFAMRGRGPRARIVPLRSDMGALWFETLVPAIGPGGGTISGLTTHADAFLLTRFAMAAGMRLSHRAVRERAGLDALIAWRVNAPARV
jgi:hypothetical protein